MWIGYRREIIVLTFPAQALLPSLWGGAGCWNVSFIILLWWPIHIINSCDSIVWSFGWCNPEKANVVGSSAWSFDNLSEVHHQSQVLSIECVKSGSCEPIGQLAVIKTVPLKTNSASITLYLVRRRSLLGFFMSNKLSKSHSCMGKSTSSVLNAVTYQVNYRVLVRFQHNFVQIHKFRTNEPAGYEKANINYKISCKVFR